MFEALEIGASGLVAQRVRMDTIAQNVLNAETTKTVRAPVVTRVALPFGVIPGLIAALQEQMRVVQEAAAEAEPTAPWPKGPLH